MEFDEESDDYEEWDEHADAEVDSGEESDSEEEDVDDLELPLDEQQPAAHNLFDDERCVKYATHGNSSDEESLEDGSQDDSGYSSTSSRIAPGREYASPAVSVIDLCGETSESEVEGPSLSDADAEDDEQPMSCSPQKRRNTARIVYSDEVSALIDPRQ